MIGEPKRACVLCRRLTVRARAGSPDPRLRRPQHGLGVSDRFSVMRQARGIEVTHRRGAQCGQGPTMQRQPPVRRQGRLDDLAREFMTIGHAAFHDREHSRRQTLL